MAKNKRRRARGDGSIVRYKTGREWKYRAKLPGGRGGKAGFATHAEAAAWLRANAHRGGAPGTVGSWLAEWLALRERDVSPRTHADDRYRVNHCLLPHLGDVRLRDLDGVKVKAALGKLLDKKKNPASDSERQKAGATLRKALNFAVDHGRLGANPMQRVRLPTPKRPEKRILTEAELRALCRVADVLGCGWWVRLWADAGLRPGEMLGLWWEDIDLQKGTVTVRRTLDNETHKLKEPKTRRSRRTIDLAPSTVAALASVVRDGSRVFLADSRGGHYWLSNFSEDVLKPLGEAAGVPWVYPYIFRHSMASHLLRAGRPIKEVSDRLGHATVTQTLNTYAHAVEGDQKRSAEVIERLLNG